jgi:phenylacetate-CoA ligase
MGPEIVAGDPISFAVLLDLPTRIRPRALLSVSMMLTAGLRARLEARFGCPVIDLYSMNEVGPIGVADAAAGGHVLLQPRLYVEIVGPDGGALPAGVRGEVCVTGGFNFCLPLLRYRTGDFASLAVVAGEVVLIGLSGRRPVRFRTADGKWVNNIDISHALQPLSTAQFAVHQAADGAVKVRLSPHALFEAERATELLRGLLGAVPVTVGTIGEEGKVLQYTSDLAGAAG